MIKALELSLQDAGYSIAAVHTNPDKTSKCVVLVNRRCDDSLDIVYSVTFIDGEYKLQRTGDRKKRKTLMKSSDFQDILCALDVQSICQQPRIMRILAKFDDNVGDFSTITYHEPCLDRIGGYVIVGLGGESYIYNFAGKEVNSLYMNL